MSARTRIIFGLETLKLSVVVDTFLATECRFEPLTALSEDVFYFNVSNATFNSAVTEKGPC